MRNNKEMTSRVFTQTCSYLLTLTKYVFRTDSLNLLHSVKIHPPWWIL